jgi:hypothetical protein
MCWLCGPAGTPGADLPQPESISEYVTEEGCVVIQSVDETGTHVTLQGDEHE